MVTDAGDRARSSRCTPTRASTPRRSRVTTRRRCRRTSTCCNADPDNPLAAARVPRALPAGLHVQDRRRPRPRSTPAPRRPDDDVPDVATSFLPPQAGQVDRELRRRAAAAARSRTASSHSCNTTFAQLGLELGEKFPPALRRLRDLRGAAARPRPRRRGEHRPGAGHVRARTSRSSRSPASARATSPPRRCRWRSSRPAVANGGVIMQPHVAAEIRDDEGKKLETIAAEAVEDGDAAHDRRDDPRLHGAGRRSGGTGTAARSPGITVAGKTGTAQTCEGCSPHAWFVAFAPAEAPQYAVVGDRRARAAAWATRRPVAAWPRRSPATCCSSCSRRRRRDAVTAVAATRDAADRQVA